MKTGQVTTCRENTAQTSATPCQLALMGEYGAHLAEAGHTTYVPHAEASEAHTAQAGGAAYGGSLGDPSASVAPACVGGLMALLLLASCLAAALFGRRRR